MTPNPAPITSRPVPTGLADIRALVAPELKALDDAVRGQLRSDVVLVNQIGHHIVGAGGKRIRPLVLLLAARAMGYRGSRHVDLAAVIEFIHTATLLHDDVVDESDLRRGRVTANARFGNPASVLVGDFIYSRSFEMMVAVGDMRVMEILAHTTNAIAEGEVLQLLNSRNPDTTEAGYMEVIRRKTAKLFDAAARIGAVLAGSTPDEEIALGRYGLHLGMAYQLIDDVLDFRSDPAATGKNIGDDLAGGKPTLPVIEAIRRTAAGEGVFLREAIATGGRENVTAVVAAVESAGALAYTASLAREQADQAIRALDAIGDSPWREGLKALARFAVERDR